MAVPYKTIREVEARRADIERSLGIDKTPIEVLIRQGRLQSALQSDQEAAVIYLHLLDLFHAGETGKVNLAADAILALPKGTTAEAIQGIRFLKAFCQRTEDSRRTYYRHVEQGITSPTGRFLFKALLVFHEAAARNALTARDALTELGRLAEESDLPAPLLELVVGLLEFHMDMISGSGSHDVIPLNRLLAVSVRVGGANLGILERDLYHGCTAALQFLLGHYGRPTPQAEVPEYKSLPWILPGRDQLRVVDQAMRDYFSSGNRAATKAAVDWLLARQANHLSAITVRNQLVEAKISKTGEDWQALKAGAAEERQIRRAMRGSHLEDHQQELLLIQSEAALRTHDGDMLEKLLHEAESAHAGTLLSAVVAARAAKANKENPAVVEHAIRVIRRVPRNLAEIVDKTPKPVLDDYFGTRDPALIEEHLVILSRRTRKLVTLTLEVAIQRPPSPDLDQVKDVAREYAKHEKEILRTFHTLLDQAGKKYRRLYSVRAYVPYTVLLDRGIEVVEYTVNRETNTVEVRLEFSDDAVVALPNLQPEYRLAIPDQPDLSRLLTLMVIDFWNLGQLGSRGYESVFENMDTARFRSFAHVDFAEARERMQRAAHAGIVTRTPTAEETAVTAAAAKIEKSKRGPRTGDAAEQKRKIIFRQLAYPQFPQNQKITIDTRKYFAEYPVAKLLEHLEVEAKESELKVLVRTHGQELTMTIFPDGSCRLENQNRGFTNLRDWQLFSAAVLDILTAHTVPDYKRALGLQHPEDEIDNIWTNACQTPTAIAEKLALYRELGSAEAGFEFEGADRLPNPFDSLFFEVISREERMRRLRPRPELTVEKLPDEIGRGKEFATLMLVGVHLRKTRKNPATHKRKLEYIRRYVLPTLTGETFPPGEKPEEVILKRIATGEGLDPHGYLVASRTAKDGADFVKSVKVIKGAQRGGKVLEAHYTFVRGSFRAMPPRVRRRRRQYVPRTSGPAAATAHASIGSVIVTQPAGKMGRISTAEQANLNARFRKLSRLLNGKMLGWWVRAETWSEGRLDGNRLRRIQKAREDARGFEVELLELFASEELE